MHFRLQFCSAYGGKLEQYMVSSHVFLSTIDQSSKRVKHAWIDIKDKVWTTQVFLRHRNGDPYGRQAPVGRLEFQLRSLKYALLFLATTFHKVTDYIIMQFHLSGIIVQSLIFFVVVVIAVQNKEICLSPGVDRGCGEFSGCIIPSIPKPQLTSIIPICTLSQSRPNSGFSRRIMSY